MTTDTRQLILDTAIRLFEERGYAGTTMRAIATEAGLSPSNAYYWFASKNQLVQEFYRRIQVAHRELSATVLAGGGTLSERLLGVERAGLEVMAPYHGFGAAFVGTAIVPGAAVSPFSEESAGARELSMEIYRDVVAGASPAVPGQAGAGAARPALARSPQRDALLGDRHQPRPAAHPAPGRPFGGDARERRQGVAAPGCRRADQPGRLGARRRGAGTRAIMTALAPVARRRMTSTPGLLAICSPSWSASRWPIFCWC